MTGPRRGPTHTIHVLSVAPGTNRVSDLSGAFTTAHPQWLERNVAGSGGGVEPLDEEEVDFLLVVEDEVNEMAGVVGAEGPASDGAGGVVLVMGSAVPRGELEGGQDLGEVGECLGGQRVDLVRHRGVGDDA